MVSLVDERLEAMKVSVEAFILLVGAFEKGYSDQLTA